MGVNGVSHHVVEDDLEGCAAVLQWLSYIAPVLGGPSAALPTTDPIERNIGYLPGPGAAVQPAAALPSGARSGVQRVPRPPCAQEVFARAGQGAGSGRARVLRCVSAWWRPGATRVASAA